MKKLKLPDTISLLMIILVIFVVLTWLIPSGEFDRIEQGNRTLVVPGTYHAVESRPQGIWDFFKAPFKGFVSAADIIVFVLFAGGSFGILNRTSSIDAGLRSIINLGLKRPKMKSLIIALIMVLFSFGGATFGMCEEVLVFILITIPLAIFLGYDSMVGIAIPFVGAGAGFAGAFINPFTLGVAQGIAQVKPLSGFGYRLIVWLVLTAISIIFVIRYAYKIEKNPHKSLVYDIDKKRKLSNTITDNATFTLTHKFVLFGLLVAFSMLVIGVNFWDWWITEIAALFLILGVFSAIVGRLKSKEAVDAFITGASEMMITAFVIGLAKGLIIVATDSKIIDTILNSIASATEGFAPVISSWLMFVLQGALNFFVPSGSGQAALTIPIMAPLSDLLGVTRQTAILAFQLGDGLCNLVIPTSGVTMGVLTIANIPFGKWIKWILPLMIIFFIVSLILLVPPVMIGWQ